MYTGNVEWRIEDISDISESMKNDYLKLVTLYTK